MELLEISRDIIEDLLKKIENNSLSNLVFKNAFSKIMFKASCNTIKNSNTILDVYQNQFNKNLEKGEKLFLVFGVLQGLFTSIDALYNLGRSLLIDKLMININRNEQLREIKYIRNDVVGHPSYRYYDDKQVGFCFLDEDDITDEKFHYSVYTFPRNTLTIEKHSVDLLKIIENYKEESIEIIKQTLSFIELIEQSQDTDLTTKILTIAKDYSKTILNIELLKEVEADFCKLLGIREKTNNRFLWRTGLIKVLFKEKKNKYIDFLIFAELRKLYSLTFKFSQRLNPNTKYKFISYKIPLDFAWLSNQLLKNKKFDFNILKDSHHPLFKDMYSKLINEYINNSKVSELILWMKKYLDAEDHNMLYLIGSQLKKYKNDK